MKKLGAALVVALSAFGPAACGTLNWASSATVPTEVVTVTDASLDGLIRAAAGVVQNPATPLSEVKDIAPAEQAAAKARDQLLAYKKTHGDDAIGLSGLKEGAETAYGDLKSVLVKYGVVIP